MRFINLAVIFSAFVGGVFFVNAASAQGLTAYCGMLADDCRVVFNDFEENTGIKVAFTRLSAGEIVARVRAERENPQASLWFSGAAENFIQAAREGLLAPYQAVGIETISPNNRPEDDMWTPVSQSPLVLVYNEQILAETDAPPPTGWQSFADPAYAEAGLALAHPSSAGTAYTVLATIMQIFGEEPGFDLFKRADANVVQYTRSGVAPLRMAANGEIGLGTVFLHELETTLAEGYQISYVFPEEGTGFELNAAALVANGPPGEMEAARRFLDWIITPQGQQAMGKVFRAPIVPGLPRNSKMQADISTARLIDYNFVWAGENRARLLERYEREIRQGSDAK